MQQRQKYLIGLLLGTVVVWQMGGWVLSAISEPFQTRDENLERLKKSVSDKNDSLRALAKSSKSLKEWRASSLPPDPGKSKQPTAINAQRLYLQWVTDLAELTGFEDAKIVAGPTSLKGKVYVAVSVKLDGQARFEQLTHFLDLFYRTDLLHRITSMRVSTKVFEGDPLLSVSLEAEGLALLDAPSRRTLFPETNLVRSLSDDATTMQVGSSKEFPNEAGFRVKIRNEFLKVTAINGDEWTVERAVERTLSANHAESTPVELVRLKAEATDRTLVEFRQMIANNFFVKPAPKYKMRLGPLGEKTFIRGKPIDFMIPALGYDTLLGKPEFTSTGDVPAGLKIEKSGKLTWKPDQDVKAGKHPVTFEVRHPSAPDGRLTETVTIRLKDPVAAPKLTDSKPPTVYLNRDWKFSPSLANPESSSKWTWKLGDKAPKGLTVDSKSGELKWVPGDEIPLGESTIPLVVVDGESPPQSTNLTLKINVQDDAAQFTRLTTIFAVGDDKRIYLTDQSTDQKTVLHEGDKFSVSDITGKIKTIGRKYVIISLGPNEIRWDNGQSLREAQERIKDY